MIKTVIFDIDNTLYDYDKAHAAAFQALTDYGTEKLGLAADDFQSLHKRMQSQLHTRMGDTAAIHSRAIRYQNMLEQTGLPLYPHVLEMDAVYWHTLLDAAEPSPGAAAAMETLKKQGIKIGIGTDMTAVIQFKKLTKLNLLGFVDFLVSSEEAGAEKPEPAVFALCIEKAGCAAQECLFIGDSLTKDVAGARAAGMNALWYRPAGPVPGETVPQVSDLHVLPRMTAQF